jgi:DNA (cytosine-5)-methyltransferase 1
MNVVLLDLFSGIGGFPKGLESAGFNITNHYFSEIDKHAIANYKHNFKDAQYVGSVTDVRGSQLPKRPNIITFGSPCQDFSLAGKRKGMDGERSSLISHAIRLITECRPDFFIWENVKGTFSSNNGADFWAIIQAFANIGQYRLEWQLLNTAWLLPQNRERIYLVGHLGKGSGRNVFPFGEDDQVFDQQVRNAAGENECIKIAPARSINARQHKMGSDDTYINVPQKAGTLTGGGHSGGLHSDMTTIKVKSATNSGYETATEGDSINLSQPDSETRRGRVGKGKAQTLETSCNQAVILGAVTMQRTEEGKKLRSEYEAGEVKHGYNEHREQTIREDGLTNTLDSSIKSQMVAVCARIRRLTEIECERLQGFPDNWTKYGINDKGETITTSRTQRYKMCGNAVTVAVVQMIGDRLIQTMQNPQQ